MKVTGKQTVDVFLEDSEVKNIIKTYIKNKYKIDDDYYIDGEDLKVAYEEYYGSHSSTRRRTVRIASDLDKGLVALLEDL